MVQGLPRVRQGSGRRLLLSPLTPPGAALPISDKDFMDLAIAEAEKASALGEVPVGCVIVDGEGAVLARAHNEREGSGDPTAHAEILALRRAAEAIGHWRLVGATAYVTLEPCPMCAGAFVNARVPRVVYGASDPKAGATHSLYAIGLDGQLNHTFECVPGLEAARCGALLSRFFSRLRKS